MSFEKERLNLVVDSEIKKLIDIGVETTDANSRSEFVSKAVKMYTSWLDGGNYAELLAPALSDVIDKKTAYGASRISSVMFKLAVEISMLMHTVAFSNDIDTDELDRLRGICVKDVKDTKGKIKFEDIAVRYE